MQGGKTMGIFVLILQIILLAVVIFGGFSLLCLTLFLFSFDLKGLAKRTNF